MARDPLSVLYPPRSATPTLLDRATDASTYAALDAHLRAVREIPTTYRLVKRGLDILVSATVLLILSPLLVFTILAIKLTSKGPAFFSQQRVGEGGRIFTMYKLRSMYQDSDHTLHQIAYAHFVQGLGGTGKVDHASLRLAEKAISSLRVVEDDLDIPHLSWVRRQLHRLRPLLHAEDPRITPIGALIRITSIDELPQLFNVLRGDMTLVGPRPPIPYEVRLYGPKHLRRLTVCPGVTGIWQVRGRNRVSFEQMVDMDIEYIENRSLWLDLKLMALTIPAVFAPRGAK